MRSSALILVLLGAAASPARAADYLPLQVGNHWVYAGTSGGHEETSITATFERNGATVSVMSYGAAGPNAGLLNFWTSESDGDVLLWGVDRQVEGFGWYYDPPLRLVDAPLAVGKKWSQTSRRIDLSTGQPIDEITIGFEVYESTHLDLPAGGFDTYGIGQSLPFGWFLGLAGEVTRLRQGPAQPAATNAVDWWCEGIGEVQFWTDQIYQLQSFDIATPTLANSWGEVKRRYR